MNCEKFQTIAGDLARDEMMEASARAAALAHVDQCQDCQRLWSDQRELSDGLRSLAQQMSSLAAPAALEVKLRAALRERTYLRPEQAEPPRWRYWAVAIAAVLLIAIAVAAWRVQVAGHKRTEFQASSKPAPPAPMTPPENPKPAPGDPSRNDSTLPGPAGAAGPAGLPGPVGTVGPVGIGPKHVNAPRPKRDRAVVPPSPVVDSTSAVASNTDAKEVTTDFVALGYGSALDLQDGGQLVRVELPRSALVRFGLPLNMDRADERVKADVLVGADGLARAIRFVK